MIAGPDMLRARLHALSHRPRNAAGTLRRPAGHVAGLGVSPGTAGRDRAIRGRPVKAQIAAGQGVVNQAGVSRWTVTVAHGEPVRHPAVDLDRLMAVAVRGGLEVEAEVAVEAVAPSGAIPAVAGVAPVAGGEDITPLPFPPRDPETNQLMFPAITIEHDHPDQSRPQRAQLRSAARLLLRYLLRASIWMPVELIFVPPGHQDQDTHPIS